MDLQLRIIKAMKTGNTVERDILRLVLSEKERTNSPIEKIAEKIIESNNEVLKYKNDEKLVSENEILSGLIPKKMTKDEIFDLLSSLKSDIIVGNEGKAIGLAMKAVKEKGLSVSGDDVKFVVKSLRESVNA